MNGQSEVLAPAPYTLDLDDIDFCFHCVEYHGPLRTAVETLFCSFIVGVYIPQYISIIRHGTRGIASRYILFHYLFSICTLGQRVSHNNFYKAHWVRVIFLAGPPVTRAVVILRYEAVQIKLLNYQDRLTDKNSTRNERYFETEHVWGH